MAGGTQPPVAYASVNELNGILTPLQQTAQSMQADLGKMRIEKWKTDASNKQQTLANVDSIQRNLQEALPEMIAQLNNSPRIWQRVSNSTATSMHCMTYFGSVVENRGSVRKPKDEISKPEQRLNGLESARRAFGERMQKLAASKEDELTRLRAQVKTLSAAPPPPPKKIVVDDTEPPKKAPAKKKVTKPKPPATTTDAPPSASPTK
jgi:hypothetical protein